MGLKQFKDIIDSRAYRISSKDRNIFERETIQSFFGLSDNDMIEVIIYDESDNQLPQSKEGNLVRYIPLNSENIREYFLIPTNVELEAYKFPAEYFIDAKRIANEAGYNNGQFKVQISLLGSRVGVNIDTKKLWVQQISPSRTELRVLPLVTSEGIDSKLLMEYNKFLIKSIPSYEIRQYANLLLEQIDVNLIPKLIIDTFGKVWLDSFITKYAISDFDILCTDIYQKFTQSVLYEIENRISDVDNINYGNIKSEPMSDYFNSDDFYNRIVILLKKSIMFFLKDIIVETTADTNER